MNTKQIKKFKALVRAYGIEVEGNGGHMAILKDGRRVGTLSHTGDANAMRAAIYDLARQNLVPVSLKREKFS